MIFSHAELQAKRKSLYRAIQTVQGTLLWADRPDGSVDTREILRVHRSLTALKATLSSLDMLINATGGTLVLQ